MYVRTVRYTLSLVATNPTQPIAHMLAHRPYLAKTRPIILLLLPVPRSRHRRGPRRAWRAVRVLRAAGGGGRGGLLLNQRGVRTGAAQGGREGEKDCYPTNIASVNLVMSCSKVFTSLIYHLCSVSTPGQVLE